MSTTLSLSRLTADLLRIHAHGLAETNVTEVQHTAGGAIYFATDTSELEANLAEARASEACLEAELKQAEEKQAKLDAENEKLTEMHLEFADKESGITPATYRDKAEEAERRRLVYERSTHDALAERDALRKRKGVTCELFKNAREIENFLQLCAAGKLLPAAVALHATEIRAKLYTKTT